MAKIQYIAPSPKTGQIEHVRPDTARTLVAAGFAIEIPFKDFRERLREEGQGIANNPNNTNPCVEGTRWGVKDAGDSGFGVAAIIKQVGSETTYYSSPPPDCPKGIVKQFEDLSSSTRAVDAAAALDTAKRAQLEYDEKIKHVRKW
jgi:hypothetical protein